VTKHFDVIVAGVGSMGASACYQLARRGVKVLGLEQFDIPNTLGAAGGFSRMIRLAYFEHPDYVALLHRAYELWHEIEQDSGQKLFHKTGGLYAGRPDSDLISGSLRAAGDYKLPHEQLDHAEARRRFPQFQLPDDYVGFFEPEAGMILSDATVATYAAQAMRHGAQLQGRESVVEWKAYAGGVAVKTDKDTYNADRLILCTGAWTSKLLHGLDIQLTVTRQVLGWLWPRRPEYFELGKFPVWAIDPGRQGEFEGVYYGFPMMDQNPGFKIARHFPADPTDPDQVDRTPTEQDIEEFMPAVHQYFPDALGPLLAARVCMYTNSADGHFIIDKHPEHPQVILACGFSGHGFKFVSAIGQILADLAQHGQSELPIEFLSLDRLTKS
jgi:sarcosine oxidase